MQSPLARQHLKRRTIVQMIETEHRGYKIRYAENEDVWRCHTLDMQGDTLTQLKNKINRHLAKMAKTGGIAALVSSFGHSKFEECEIVSVSDKGGVWIAKSRVERWQGATRTVKERSKVEADRLVLDTVENREMIKVSDDYLHRISTLTNEGKEYFKTIPRVDVSTLPKGGDDD